MKKIFSLAASATFLFAVIGIASVSASQSEDNLVVTMANSNEKTKMQQVKNKVQHKVRQNSFMRQCMEHGNSENSCEMREEAVAKGTRELRREERRAFVDMIVESKLSCIDEYGKENRIEVRKCFREKVKMGVVNRIKSVRDLRKDCREELPEDTLAKEVNLCALQKHLGQEVTVLDDEDEDEDEDENEEEYEEDEDEDEEEYEEDEENSTFLNSCQENVACSMLTTCEEAEYQLNSCNQQDLDSDDDGIPCESLCTEK